jgi:taurine dioxygenase
MPMKITPNEEIFGARIEGIDLAQPLSRNDFAAILTALDRYAVLCFPNQKLDARSLKAFSEHFGSLQGSPAGT